MMLARREFLGAVAGCLLARRAGAAPTDHAALRWRLTAPPLQSGDPAPVVTAVALSPSGRWVAAGGDDHTLRLWQVESGKLLRTVVAHHDWVAALAFAPDSRTLVSAARDGQVRLWRLPDLEAATQLRASGGAATAVRFSPDGRWMAINGFHQPLELLPVRPGGEARRLPCPCRDMRALAFSADSRLLAAGGRNGKLRVWRLPEAARLYDLQAHARRVGGVACSPDGRLWATVGEDRRIRLWHITTGKLALELPRQPAKLLAVTFLGPACLATAGSDDRITVWDLSHRTPIDRLFGHQGSISALDVSTQWLVSGSFDATVCVWSRDAIATAPPTHLTDTR